MFTKSVQLTHKVTIIYAEKHMYKPIIYVILTWSEHYIMKLL